MVAVKKKTNNSCDLSSVIVVDSKAVWADLRHFPGRENIRAFGQRVSTMDLLIACCFKGETSTDRHIQILTCPCIVIFRI